MNANERIIGIKRNSKFKSQNSIRQLADRIVSCLVDKADPDFHQDDDFL